MKANLQGGYNMKSFHDIENALRDFSWMQHEVIRLEKKLQTVNTSVTAAYGIEASMPKGSGTSDQTGTEVLNREQERRTLNKFKKKLQFVEQHSDCIEDDREITVLNCLLDGMSIVGISQHMRFSERQVYKIKDEIVRKMMKSAENAGNADIAG